MPDLYNLTCWVLESLLAPDSELDTSAQDYTSAHPPWSISTIVSKKQKPSLKLPGPSRRLHIQPTHESRSQGIRSILQFIRTLIPLIIDGLPSHPTQLQSVVCSHMDYYLPFCECTTSRLRITGIGGPFHSDLIDNDGAFASWVIFRVLLFDLPALRDHTQGYFASSEEFNHFLDEQHFDGSAASADALVNISCYGSPQPQRRDGLRQAHVYFLREDLWHEFTEQHDGNSIPFRSFYDWTQRRIELPSVDGACKHDIFLPLVGKLTGFLLTADLIYAGKVECPEATEMGSLVFDLGLGAKHGLQVANLVGAPNSNRESVVEAFVQTYEFLENEFAQDECCIIRFDSVMLEHTLCKFQRLTRKMTHRGYSIID